MRPPAPENQPATPTLPEPQVPASPAAQPPRDEPCPPAAPQQAGESASRAGYLPHLPTRPEGLRPPEDQPPGEHLPGPNAPSDREATVPVTSPPSPAAPGSARPVLPGYEVLHELGQGGMGVVYKARQRALNRVVALKMILAGSRAGPQELARFRTEAEAVARLQHPNIVQIYEVGQHQGLPYFSLEYADGGSLDQKLRGTPLPSARAASLTETLARAMHSAHQRGIVHRDLKPANVLLTADGTPKVTDFGLAKKLDEAGQTQSGAVMGTPSYMAPEQAQGLVREIGPAADVYALGAILYELLTGRPPFKSSTLWDTVRQVVSVEPVPPRRLEPRTPPDLETICLKCLEKNPARRYGSAAALADDLRRFLEGRPILARPLGPVGRTLKWARRRPAVAALLASVLLTALGAASWAAQHLHRQQQEERRVTELRGTAQELIIEGQAALARARPQVAESRLNQALLLARQEPALADLLPRIKPLLQKARADQDKKREAARAQQQWQEFRTLCNKVLLQETLFTGLGQQARINEAREAARKALARFGVTLQSSGPPQASRYLTSSQRKQLLPACYELLLSWAEATARPLPGAHEDPHAQAKQALRILDRASALGLQTRALHLRRARYLALLGDAAGARREQALARQLKPSGAVDHFLVGVEAYSRGELAQAREHLEEALKLQPDHFWASYGLAMCQLRQHHWGEAKASFTACLGLQPDFAWPYLLRGYAHGELREFAAAHADFARAEALHPDEVARYGIHVNRGLVLLREGRPDDAAQEFRKAIALCPSQYQAHADLAEVYRRQGQLGEALTQLDQALVLNRSAGLYRTRARLHLARTDFPAARADLERAIAAEPAGTRSAALAEDHVERGRILYRQGRYRDALEAFDQALTAHPRDYPLAHRLRAEALLELGRYREAARAVDHYLRQKGPPRADAYRVRGLARAKLRDYAGAAADYTRALEIDRLEGKRTDARTLTYRGWAYLTQDAPRLALPDFDRAVRLEKSNADAYNGRGYARVLLGDHRAAIADAEQALDRGRRSPRLLYNAARIFAQAAGRLPQDPRDYERQGYEDRAVALLREALAEVPAEGRPAFWKDYVHSDPALFPVRNTPGFARLQAQLAAHSP